MTISVRVKRTRPLPKPALTAAKLQAVIREEQLREAKSVQKDFVATAKTWEQVPTFIIDPTAQGVNVYTDNPIYGYVDKGTRPHIIQPKGPYPLRFNSAGFSPKTRPGKLNAVAGSPAGPPQVRAMIVHHPGTKARHLSRLVKTRSERRFGRNLHKRIQRELAR